MKKQLTFTDFEQGVVTELLKNIGSILLEKMDEGVEAPTLSGSMDIESEGRIVTFEITAKNK